MTTSSPRLPEMPALVYPRDHWSPAQFQCWDLCPQTYYERYFIGEQHLPSEAMLFGSAIHRALEAHYLGNDGDRQFKESVRTYGIRPQLVASGLFLLELVYDLQLTGVPEQRFELDTRLAWGLPTIGSIDLIDADTCTVYDFKTTVGEWGQARADRDPWQPTLYRWAAHERYGLADGGGPDGSPWAFQYVVLNRRTLEVDMFEPTMAFEDAWGQCYEGGRMISSMVRAGAFPCTGQHGTCPECGAKWQHEHVCDWSLLPPRIHLAGARRGREQGG